MNQEWHPELWTEAERNRWLLDRLRQWATRWRTNREYLQLLQQQDHDNWKRRLRNEVGEFLRRARRYRYHPLYRACNCGCRNYSHLRDELGYMRWPRLARPLTSEEIVQWQTEDPEGRAFLLPQMARALCTIDQSKKGAA